MMTFVFFTGVFLAGASVLGIPFGWWLRASIPHTDRETVIAQRELISKQDDVIYALRERAKADKMEHELDARIYEAQTTELKQSDGHARELRALLKGEQALSSNYAAIIEDMKLKYEPVIEIPALTGIAVDA